MSRACLLLLGGAVFWTMNGASRADESLPAAAPVSARPPSEVLPASAGKSAAAPRGDEVADDRGRLDSDRGDIERAREDEVLLQGVAHRLAIVAEPPDGVPWPPLVELLEDREVQACAGLVWEGTGAGARPVSRVFVTRPMMRDVVHGNPDRLAWLLGHEMNHILLGHSTRPPQGQTAFVRQVFSRSQELDCDLEGMKLALKAGYSKTRGFGLIHRLMQLAPDYSSFEGHGVDHPSWKERLAHIDKEQASLWTAMGAFQNGTLFLALEQYASAERCFREVCREFPTCPEAWTNLGYALLMQYCDALDARDVRAFDVGAIMLGGFYRRPASLEGRVRGVNEELWADALAAFRESLRVHPNQPLAKAGLGIVYLVRPAGRNAKLATRYFDEAVELAGADRSLIPVQRASILVNAGVAYLAADRPDVAQRKFREAEEGAQQAPAANADLAGCLGYNRGLILEASPDSTERLEALRHFESYLQTTTRAAAWWPLGYEHYQKLCEELRVPDKSPQQLAARTRAGYRLITSIGIGEGALVIEQPLAEVRQLLGEGEAVPVVPNTSLIRWRYPSRGVDVLATERVLAICLYGSHAPAVPLRETGLGGKTFALRPEMAEQDFSSLLKDQNFRTQKLDQPDVLYRFYPEVGLACRVSGGKVVELVIAQLSRRPLAGHD